ncbi:MAG: DUF4920 domain-containing protein [Wenzhouxiangella sp.]
MTRPLALILGLLLVATPAAAAEWFGTSPAHADNAIGVATIMAAPEDWVGRQLLVGGRITDVCTNRGCWAVFEDNGDILRIMVRDHAFALPADARGPALAYGELEKVEISAGHARH